MGPVLGEGQDGLGSRCSGKNVDLIFLLFSPSYFCCCCGGGGGGDCLKSFNFSRMCLICQ